MSDSYNVRRAAALLGGLSAHGRTPNPADEAEARRTLATARLDREARNTARAGVVLDPVQVGHLVGLLVGNAGADYDTTRRIELAAVRAVRDTQGGAQ